MNQSMRVLRESVLVPILWKRATTFMMKIWGGDAQKKRTSGFYRQSGICRREPEMRVAAIEDRVGHKENRAMGEREPVKVVS